MFRWLRIWVTPPPAFVAIKPFEALIALASSDRINADVGDSKFGTENEIVFVSRSQASELRLRAGVRVGLIRENLFRLEQQDVQNTKISIKVFEEEKREREELKKFRNAKSKFRMFS